MIQVGETKTMKQYLHDKEQQELDELFDKAIKEAREKELQELKCKEHEEHFNKLITSLADREAEVNELEEIYRQMYESNNYSKDELDNIKVDIKNAKMLYTRCKNDVDRFIESENKVRSN